MSLMGTSSELAGVAAKTEQLRARWVSDRMVAAGRARAASLGWPDAYAYTKALGERALIETHGDVPVSIVRPSIIESALAELTGLTREQRPAEQPEADDAADQQHVPGPE